MGPPEPRNWREELQNYGCGHLAAQAEDAEWCVDAAALLRGILAICDPRAVMFHTYLLARIHAVAQRHA